MRSETRRKTIFRACTRSLSAADAQAERPTCQRCLCLVRAGLWRLKPILVQVARESSRKPDPVREGRGVPQQSDVVVPELRAIVGHRMVDRHPVRMVAVAVARDQPQARDGDCGTAPSA